MSYRIVAHNSDASTGVAKSNAQEALRAVREFDGEGFELTAIIDDDGDRVAVETLEHLAVTETTARIDPHVRRPVRPAPDHRRQALATNESRAEAGQSRV